MNPISAIAATRLAATGLQWLGQLVPDGFQALLGETGGADVAATSAPTILNDAAAGTLQDQLLEFSADIEQELARQGLPAEPLELTLNASQRVVVTNDYPHRREIEALFEQNGDLAERLRDLARRFRHASAPPIDGAIAAGGRFQLQIAPGTVQARLQ